MCGAWGQGEENKKDGMDQAYAESGGPAWLTGPAGQGGGRGWGSKVKASGSQRGSISSQEMRDCYSRFLLAGDRNGVFLRKT